MHILFAGGGTAGHINPALATADYIKSKHPDAKISYIGTAHKLEATLVPQANYDFYTIDVAGFQRKITIKNMVRNVSAAYKAVAASVRARKLLKDLKPDLVVGTGGYVSGPVLREAAKLKIKTAIHEQNAYPGITSKMLAGVVDRVMLAMPEAEQLLKCKNKPVVTGNPVRSQFLNISKEEARKKLSLDSRPFILSFGGSLGAAPINNAVAGLIADKVRSGKYQFMHAAGKSGYKNFLDNLIGRGVEVDNKDVRVLEYITNMAECMMAADLIIGRAGAITLTEIEAAGKASILIPSPYVAENHQFHNAMTLKNRNAAEVIEEKNLTDELLVATVDNLLSDGFTAEDMGKNAKESAILDASERIYTTLMELL